jgi:hypothetical protein
MRRTLNFLTNTPTPSKFKIGAKVDQMGERRETGSVKEAKRKPRGSWKTGSGMREPNRDGQEATPGLSKPEEIQKRRWRVGH